MALNHWQAWLLSERPQSRRQAALGRAYGVWRVFARNRLALAGLAIVVGLFAVALLADVIAPGGPTVGVLDQRLQLVGAAPGDAGDVALAGKTAGDGAAGGVAGADHQNGFLVAHGVAPVG